ncbi:MAG: A/G-specific adenine glycosylase, partial [Chitinophagaceae bacterium]
QLLDKADPASYNQAIMDFGAVVCKPAVPLCHKCMFNQVCYAWREKETDLLPVKAKKTKIRKRWFYYLVLQHGGETVIRQRTEKGIWQQLYEFPVVETENESTTDEVLLQAEEMGILRKGTYKKQSVSGMMKQQLSHQLIMGRFVRLELTDTASHPGMNGSQWVRQSDIGKYAFPKFINSYLGDPSKQELF